VQQTCNRIVRTGLLLSQGVIDRKSQDTEYNTGVDAKKIPTRKSSAHSSASGDPDAERSCECDASTRHVIGTGCVASRARFSRWLPCSSPPRLSTNAALQLELNSGRRQWGVLHPPLAHLPRFGPGERRAHHR